MENEEKMKADETGEQWRNRWNMKNETRIANKIDKKNCMEIIPIESSEKSSTLFTAKKNCRKVEIFYFVYCKTESAQRKYWKYIWNTDGKS